ncbi:MAG: type II secretion system protein J [Microcystaceae cyanobacterium]
MKTIRHLLQTSSKSLIKGFTLVELLIAASLTSVVISVAGYALLNMITLNTKARADSTLAYDVNRSIEFISEEIKTAYEIQPDAEVAASEITDFSLPSDATPILVLTLSNGKNVVYYSQPSSEPWGGDQVIKRWGPDFDENGDYDDSTLQTPSSWSHNVLMDYISDESVDYDQCPVNWQMTNDDATRGFYACAPVTGATTSLVQFGIMADAPHTVGLSSLYAAQTNAYTRSGSLMDYDISCKDGSCIATPPDLEDTPTTDTPAIDTPAIDDPIIDTDISTTDIATADTSANLQDGKILIEGDASVTFKVLGTQITCDAYGDSIPVTANIYVTEATGGRTRITLDNNNSTQTLNVTDGSVIDMRAIAKGGSCEHSNSVNTIAPNEKLVALIDGDNVPNIPPFADQESITSIVQPYVSGDKMTMASNEVIHLFELGTNSTSSEAFDLQDLVLLTSITAIQ